MVKERVTKDDLKAFAVGDMKTFTLPNYNRARAAQSYANQLKKDIETYGWIFKTVIGDQMEGTMQRTLTITRIA